MPSSAPGRARRRWRCPWPIGSASTSASTSAAAASSPWGWPWRREGRPSSASRAAPPPPSSTRPSSRRTTPGSRSSSARPTGRPSCTTPAHRRPSSRTGCSPRATRWASRPGVPAEGQEDTWRPLAVRAFEEAVHGANGPGPVHLNLEFREPLTGTAAPLPAPPRSEGRRSGDGRATRRRPRTACSSPCEGGGLIIAGGPWSQRADPAGVAGLAAASAAGPCWPTRCREAGWRARSPPPMPSSGRSRPLPECIVLLGVPWLSRALGTFVSHAARAGARIIVVDPWRQWADPLTGGDRVPPVRGRRLARRRHRDRRHRPIRSGSTRGGSGRPRRRRPSPRCWGPISVSRSWPARSTATRRRRAPPSWWRHPCRSGTSSGTPSPSRRRRGCWPTGA